MKQLPIIRHLRYYYWKVRMYRMDTKLRHRGAVRTARSMELRAISLDDMWYGRV